MRVKVPISGARGVAMQRPGLWDDLWRVATREGGWLVVEKRELEALCSRHDLGADCLLAGMAVLAGLVPGGGAEEAPQAEIERRQRLCCDCGEFDAGRERCGLCSGCLAQLRRWRVATCPAKPPVWGPVIGPLKAG